MKMSRGSAVGAIIGFSLTWSAIAQSLAPLAPKVAVTNSYFGNQIVDNYQWLENFGDPAVQKWTAEENHLSRAYFNTLPARAAIATRLQTLYSDASANYMSLAWRPGIFFAMKSKPPAQQPWLVLLSPPDAPAWKWTVVNPKKPPPRGNLAVDWMV